MTSSWHFLSKWCSCAFSVSCLEASSWHILPFPVYSHDQLLYWTLTWLHLAGFVLVKLVNCDVPSPLSFVNHRAPCFFEPTRPEHGENSDPPWGQRLAIIHCHVRSLHQRTSKSFWVPRLKGKETTGGRVSHSPKNRHPFNKEKT